MIIQELKNKIMLKNVKNSLSIQIVHLYLRDMIEKAQDDIEEYLIQILDNMEELDNNIIFWRERFLILGYKKVNDVLSTRINILINKLIDYPFPKHKDLNLSLMEIERQIEDTLECYKELVDAYAEDVPNKETCGDDEVYPDEEGLRDPKDVLLMELHSTDIGELMQVRAEYLIGKGILIDSFLVRKHKNRPIILSGLWGVVGSLLGAAIGAYATLLASGVVTWPFK